MNILRTVLIFSVLLLTNNLANADWQGTQESVLESNSYMTYENGENNESDVESWGRTRSRTGNFCKDQYENFLYNTYGQDLVIGKVVKSKTGGNGSVTSFWIKTNLCTNYIVAETMAKPTCSIAHYGRVPIYIRRVWFRGDCRELSRRDLYPNHESTREPDWLRE